MWKVLLVICIFIAIARSADYITSVTGTVGNGTSINNPPPAFAGLPIISQISTTFDSLGVTSFRVCTKQVILRDDGSVYNPAAETCYLRGQVTGTRYVQNFTADEWPIGVTLCISNTTGLIVGVNITANAGYYWISGNFTKCYRRPYTSIPAGAAIYGIGTGPRNTGLPTGIGRLSIAYFSCDPGSTICKSAVYNAGGLCGKRNGDCDFSITCTNTGPSSRSCGNCDSGYIKDSGNICRRVRGAPVWVNESTSAYRIGTLGGVNVENQNYLSPYKVSKVCADMGGAGFDYGKTVINFYLGFTKVVNGAYDNSSEVTLKVYHDPRASPNVTVYYDRRLTVDEYITSISSNIVRFANNFRGIASMNITTNKDRLLLLERIIEADPYQFYVETQLRNFQPTQKIMGVRGGSGQLVDYIEFAVQNCTDNCPAEPYPSGACALNNPVCDAGSYCQDTITSYVCTCYDGLSRSKGLCLPPTDPCLQGVCDSLVQCTQNTSPLGYSCSACPANYTGSGYTQCQAIDKCLDNPCGINSVCTMVGIGEYSCSCLTGYFKLNLICEDINECSNVATCGDHRQCTNTPGSHTCGACDSGYELQNNNCTDVNECLNISKCENRACINSPGSFTCGVCNSGYELQKTDCIDINECLNATKCGANRTCINNPGSFTCGTCYPGYDLINDICQDRNECLNVTICGDNRLCTNTPGDFLCGACATGYELVANICRDINECLNVTKCGVYRTCINKPGNFTCGACFSGFELNNGQCRDTNECLNTTACGEHRQCNNTVGNFTCGACYPGFDLKADVCQDINECLNKTICGEHRGCNNTVGNFTCGVCDSGYQLENDICKDVDECTNITICGGLLCTNLNGSYSCGDCSAGYIVSELNRTCIDINECDDNQCGNFRECTNVPGNFSCGACFPRFELLGSNCSDIDECTANASTNGGCSIMAQCVNTLGGRVCICNPYYSGNGIQCELACGNKVCETNHNETCVSCPSDCGTESSCNLCGDGKCESIIGESCSTCSDDCGVCNPTMCKPACSSHGTCRNGMCWCQDTWTGPTCNMEEAERVDVDIDDDIEMKYNERIFALKLNRIVEYDKHNEIIKEIIFNSNFTFKQRPTKTRQVSSNIEWFYDMVLPNSATLNISIWQFHDPLTKFQFAGADLIFPPYTIKLKFQVNSWPFANIQNSIGLEMSSAASSSSLPRPRTRNAPTPAPTPAKTCSNDKAKQSGPASKKRSVPTRESVRWISVSYDDVTLYGKFLNLAVIDGRVRTINYTRSEFNENITAIIPHFWDNAVVDPDFQVLLNMKDPCNPNKQSNHISLGLIIGLIVGAIVLVVLIALLIAYWGKIATLVKIKTFVPSESSADAAELESFRKRSSTGVRV